MNNAQQKITEIVEDYKTIFDKEYKLFCKQQKDFRAGLLNDYAEVKGDIILERKLFDTPANLYTMFVQNLSSEELDHLKSRKGARWFAKNFKEFRAANKV